MRARTAGRRPLHSGWSVDEPGADRGQGAPLARRYGDRRGRRSDADRLGRWLAARGIAHRYSESLALERVGTSSTTGGTLRTLGALGNLARGFLLALVGGFLLDTAVQADPVRPRGSTRPWRPLFTILTVPS